MIITCIFIAMAFLGLMLIKSNTNDNAELSGLIMSVIGFTFLIMSLILIIMMHATANNAIRKNQIEYEGLCKRYEIVKSEYEDMSKSNVIGDITEWNTKVYNTKYWTKNPWTSWFNPKKIADNLEYISLK